MTDNWAGSTVLLRAADLIETVGWAQGVSGGRDAEGGAVYAGNDPDDPDVIAAAWAPTGAIDEAAIILLGDDFSLGSDQAIAALGLSMTRDGHLSPSTETDPDQLQDAWLNAIVEWNDEAGRTAAQVIDVLRRAAQLGPADVPASLWE